MEPVVASCLRHTQEARGSSPGAPIASFGNLQPHCMALPEPPWGRVGTGDRASLTKPD